MGISYSKKGIEAPITRDLSQKMDLIFTYYCPHAMTLNAKAVGLASILTRIASFTDPGLIKFTKARKVMGGEGPFVISEKTLTEWAKGEHQNYSKRAIHSFTLLLNLDEDVFLYRDYPSFLRDFVRSCASLNHLFKKFIVLDNKKHDKQYNNICSKTKYSEYEKLKGFYYCYYATPMKTISIASMFVSPLYKHRQLFKFCCMFNSTPIEYVGYWAIEDGYFYTYFEGPEEDGVSTIVATLPSLKNKPTPFEGIIVSRDVGLNGLPFSSKILCFPYLVGMQYDTMFGGQGKNSLEHWDFFKKSIPDKESSKEISFNDRMCHFASSFFTTIVAEKNLSTTIKEIDSFKS